MKIEHIDQGLVLTSSTRPIFKGIFFLLALLCVLAGVHWPESPAIPFGLIFGMFASVSYTRVELRQSDHTLHWQSCTLLPKHGIENFENVAEIQHQVRFSHRRWRRLDCIAIKLPHHVLWLRAKPLDQADQMMTLLKEWIPNAKYQTVDL
jgi:hypothetical protein